MNRHAASIQADSEYNDCNPSAYTASNQKCDCTPPAFSSLKNWNRTKYTAALVVSTTSACKHFPSYDFIIWKERETVLLHVFKIHFVSHAKCSSPKMRIHNAAKRASQDGQKLALKPPRRFTINLYWTD